MDFFVLIEQAGFRVLSGQRRFQSALNSGHSVMACDANGVVYRIAIEEKTLVVQKVQGQEADASMIIVAPVEPKMLH